MPGIPWAIGAGLGEGFTQAQQYNTNAINNQIALAQMQQLMAQQQAAQLFYHSQLLGGGGSAGLPTGEAPPPQTPPPVPTPNLQSGPQPGMQMGPQPGMQPPPGQAMMPTIILPRGAPQPGMPQGGQNFMPPSPLQTAGLPMGAPPAPPPAPAPQSGPPMGAGPAAGLAVPVPPSLAPIYQRESQGNYLAQNPKSSASGIGQDIDSTWREAMRGLGYSDKQWAHAKDAPPSVQNAANIWLQAKYGNKPWAASEPGKAAARPGAAALAQARAAGRGPPPPGAEDAALAIDNTAPNIDPVRMGNMAMHELAMQIEQANPDAPDMVKAMAFQMGMQYLAPEQRMAWEALKQENAQKFQMRKQFEHENFQQQQTFEHEDFLARQQAAAAEHKGWETVQMDGKWYRFNKDTGEREPIDAKNVSKVGTAGQARSMSGIYMQKAMEAGKDPDEAVRDYARNTTIERAFANGPIARNLISLNTIADHISLFRQYADALKNHEVQKINDIENRFATEAGSPEVINFALAGTITGDEVVRLLTTTGGTVADRDDIHKLLSTSASPEQMSGAADTLTNFVRGRYAPLRQDYARGNPGREKEFDETLVTPEARKLFAGPPLAPIKQPKPAGQPAPGGQAAPAGKDQPTSAGPNPSTGENPIDLSGLSQQDFDKEWDGLPAGQAYIGLDGKPYKKRQTPPGKK